MGLTLDPDEDLIVYWPEATPAVAALLARLPARALLTEPASLTPALLEACLARRLAVIADLPAPDVAALRAAQAAGFAAAAVPATGEPARFRKLLDEFRDFIAIVYLAPEQVDWEVAPAQAVLRSGVWPGIAPQDPATAGATSHAWLNANTSLVAQLRAMNGRRRPLLGYRPDQAAGVAETYSAPARSVEVALADAHSVGGRLVLSLPVDYRQGLLAGDARALEAWRSLIDVRAFVRSMRTVADAPLSGHTAVVCGTLEQTGELLNLAFRKNLCPVVFAPAALPPLSAAHFDLVVVANIEMPPALVDNVARFAAAGGVVVAAPVSDEKSPWWTTRGWKKLRTEAERDVYAVGRGLVYAYHDPAVDPGAFAVDLKELAGQRSQPGVGVKNLDLRLWNADTVLGVIHRLSPTTLAVVLTAYGTLPRYDFLLSVRGRFRRATIRQAGEAARPVSLMASAGRVEINLTRMSRIAIVTLEE